MARRRSSRRRLDRHPVGGPPLPMGERVELPGRGTTFVREVAGPARRADRAAAARLAGQRRAQLVPRLRRARRALPRARARPAGPRPGHPHRAGASRSPTAPTTSPPCSTQLGTGPVIAVGYSPRRPGGPAAVAPPPRSRRRARAVRDVAPPDAGHARADALRARSWPRPPAAPGSASSPTKLPVRPVRRLAAGGTPARARRRCGPGPGPRCAATTTAHILEAGVAMSNYHAKWIDEVDVPDRGARHHEGPGRQPARPGRAWRSRSRARRSTASTTATSSAPSRRSARPRSPPSTGRRPTPPRAGRPR